MEDVTNKYFQQEDFVKCSVKQNYKDISQMNLDLRWQYDNRISVADRGMLNPTCDRYFVINSGVIGQTDAYGPIKVNKHLEESEESRNVKYSGKDYWI